ncbi:hypothetical protein [Prevotella aurantiaca]
MKVIALKGEKDSGKTTTLKKVHELLMETGGEQETNYKVDLKGNDDFRDIINFAGKKIGIVTQGDYDRGNYNKNIPSDEIKEKINNKVELVFSNDEKNKNYLFSDFLKDVTEIILDFWEKQEGLTVEEHLKILESKRCDIAICAYRPDMPETEKFLDEYPNPIYLFLQNKSKAEISDEELPEKVNQKAEEIVEFLKKLILHA